MGNGHSQLSDPAKCTVPNIQGPKIIPLYGNTTFHTFAEIFSGACAAFATVLSVVLILLHAFKYSRPSEQRHIIRAVSMIAVFAILSWVMTMMSTHNAQYVLVLQDLYESYAFASFFLLIVAWIAQTTQQPKAPQYYSQGAPPHTKFVETDVSQGEMASLLGIRWALVFQFPFVMTVMTIVTEATNAAGKYCVSSHNVHFAHVWVTIIKGLSTAVAFISLLKVVHTFKRDLQPFKPTRKLISFKSIIALRFIQTFVFNFLLNGGHVSPTKYLSYNDIAVSIPSMILCLEMVLFALLFLYTFSVTPYLLKNINTELGGARYQGGPLGLRAIFQAMNIIDLLKGMITAVAVGVSR